MEIGDVIREKMTGKMLVVVAKAKPKTLKDTEMVKAIDERGNNKIMFGDEFEMTDRHLPHTKAMLSCLERMS